jgi:peroxin-5
MYLHPNTHVRTLTHSLSLSLPTHTLREAVEHFLIALNMQRQAKGPGNNRRQMSESIWSTLRLAVTFVGRQELNKLVDSRDLDGLMSEFGV